MSTGSKIDWATAEALAIGSLLYQGTDHLFQIILPKIITFPLSQIQILIFVIVNIN
jgi:hypothetical protein